MKILLQHHHLSSRKVDGRVDELIIYFLCDRMAPGTLTIISRFRQQSPAFSEQCCPEARAFEKMSEAVVLFRQI